MNIRFFYFFLKNKLFAYINNHLKEIIFVSKIKILKKIKKIIVYILSLLTQMGIYLIPYPIWLILSLEKRIVIL